MTPERLQKINDVFQSVVELDSEKRQAYLDKVCADDESLRAQVTSLLFANEGAGNFIAGNAAKDVGHLLTLNDAATLTGQSLGHYEIISILGSGGMGRVYLAKDPKLNRSIAVKTLPSSLSKEANFIKRFQTEARAAANLNHPNVATVYSVEETDDEHIFITMEYVKGNALGQSIPENGLDLLTFLEWFIPISDALTHAHEKGVVHRDIKPNNVMITPAGVPKILDFVLAQIDKGKIAHDVSTENLTKPGQILGTPAYMSPEQAEGKPSDHRTDIFSLGVVMYEAITGRRPFKGESYASIVSELLTKEPDSIEAIKPEIPSMLARLIMKCLRKEPRRRYQSMNEVRVILKEINSAVASGASLTSPQDIAISKPRTVFPYILAAIAVVFSFIGVYAVWNWATNPTDSPTPVSRFSISPESSSRLSILGAMISPDGKNLLLTTFRDEGERIHLRSLNNFEVKPIPGTEEGRRPFFSPDGKWIAFATRADTIKKVPVGGGNPVTICESCMSTRLGFWGPDNKIIFSSPKGLFRVSADGGTPEVLTSVANEKGEKAHYLPQLLPDGETVLFTVSGISQPKLALLSKTEKKWEYIEATGKAWFGKYIKTGHLIFARDKQLMAVPFDVATAKTSGEPTLVLSDLFEMAPNIQISNSGTLIYLPTISRTNNQIVWVDRNGDEIPVLDKKGDFSSPRLSPDGERLAVRFNNQIWVYTLKTGGGILIASDGKNESPIWSRDGKSIIYSSEIDNVFSVYRKSANGAGKVETLYSSPGRLRPYSVNQIDNTLAIAAADGISASDIIMKPLDGGATKPFADTKFKADTPRFSPDGKWISYFAMDSGQPQIYVHPWDDIEKKIAVTKKGGMFPVWARDGKEIFYRVGSRFYSVRVDPSNEFETSGRKLVLEGKYLTNFDVSLDGKRFLMVRDEYGTLPRKLRVVLNWDKELKQSLRIVKSASGVLITLTQFDLLRL